MFITDIEKLKEYRTENRLWQGIPSIEVTKKGRIFVCFYSGKTTEVFGNYCLLIQSDDGVHFSEPIAACYNGEDHRCFDPCLWIDPLGRLWYTWTQIPDHALFGVICDDPDAEKLTWGEEFVIGHDVMMNKPFVMKDGSWGFPASVWGQDWIPEDWKDKKNPAGSHLYVTKDQGKTFEKRGCVQPPDRTYDEHMIVTLKDGRLMMWIRTLKGIAVSFSTDDGWTWSEPVYGDVENPSARFYLGRLKSGRLLLVNHNKFTKRNNLTAMLSDDDGKTWSEGLLLDERNDVSYPDVKEADDGFLYIVYDRERGGYKKHYSEAIAEAREFLYAKVTEEDILAGKLINADSSLKNVLNKLGAYHGPIEDTPYWEGFQK